MRMFILEVTRLTCTSYIHIDSHICIGLYYDIFLSYHMRMHILEVTRLTCTSYIHIDSHICIGADLIL